MPGAVSDPEPASYRMMDHAYNTGTMCAQVHSSRAAAPACFAAFDLLGFTKYC